MDKCKRCGTTINNFYHSSDGEFSEHTSTKARNTGYCSAKCYNRDSAVRNNKPNIKLMASKIKSLGIKPVTIEGNSILISIGRVIVEPNETTMAFYDWVTPCTAVGIFTLVEHALGTKMQIANDICDDDIEIKLCDSCK